MPPPQPKAPAAAAPAAQTFAPSHQQLGGSNRKANGTKKHLSAREALKTQMTASYEKLKVSRCGGRQSKDDWIDEMVGHMIEMQKEGMT